MKKLITSIVLSSLVLFAFGQVTELWNFSVTRANQTSIVDDIKNGIAVSPDGTNLYLSTRANGSNQVAVYNPETGARTGYLPALAGFASTYGGDVAVDRNGAIYASNVIISASALMVAKWENPTATPTLFITTTNHGGSGTNRIGYGMDVYIDENGDGFLLMHANATAQIKYWQIENNSPVSNDPATITITATPTAITDSYARIRIVDKNNFWLDGNVTRPTYCTITRENDDYNAPTAINGTQLAYRTDMNAGVGGATEFLLNGKRYGIFAANNHGATFTNGHYSLFQEMTTGSTVTGSVLASIPSDGLGKTTDYSHFVESVVRVDQDCAYIYVLGGANGIAAFRADAVKTPVLTPEAGIHVGTSLNVTISSATEGAEIRYTTDGSTPTESSSLYVDGVTLPQGTTTLKLLAVKSGLLSTVSEATYTVSPVSGLNDAKSSFKIKQTQVGVELELDETSNIELYTINGTLIDKTRADGVYSRELGKGMFIIRVNGQAQKFVR